MNAGCYDQKNKVIAIIPARKGSKRLPHKNIRVLCGKPLICWTIEDALKCEFIDEIIISTDDPEVVSICQQYDYDSRIRVHNRPPELATDEAPMIEVVKNVVKEYSKDTIILLLQVTTPLRTTSDIEKAYDLFLYNKNVVSGYYLNDRTIKFNGGIYILLFIDVLCCNSMIYYYPTMYIMPKERSVDIDTLADFELAEKYLEGKEK